MTEPVLGSYYTFKYIGGNVYAPSQMIGEGMFVGKQGNYFVFAVVHPNRDTTSKIQNITLYYTTLAWHPIPSPRDKVFMTEETRYLFMKYIHSDRFKCPIDNGRTFPMFHISAEILVS